MKVKYKLSRVIPMLAIAGATVLGASCKKTAPENTPVPVPEQPQSHHNTTYVWGIDNWDAVWPSDRVAASADSTLVDIVFLQNEGNSLKGRPTTHILTTLNKIIDGVRVENRHKIRGAGTLNDVGLGSDQNYQDSIKLAQMGFKFGQMHYNGYHHK